MGVWKDPHGCQWLTQHRDISPDVRVSLGAGLDVRAWIRAALLTALLQGTLCTFLSVFSE